MKNRKYTMDGEEVEVLQELENGCSLVLSIRVDDAGEEWIANEIDARVERKLFDTPPAHKYSNEIIEYQNKIDERRQELRRLNKEIDEIHRQEKERAVKYKRFEQLKQLDDFIAGRITHYVRLSNWRPDIIEFKDTKAQYADRGEMRLLILFGSSKGNLSWKLNQYSDGSGSSDTVVPCTSYEDAVKELSLYIKTQLEADPENPPIYIVESAQKYNIDIDEKYILKCAENQEKSKLQEIEELKKKIKEKEVEIGGLHAKMS